MCRSGRYAGVLAWPHGTIEAKLMRQFRDDGVTITVLLLTGVLLMGCGEQDSNNTQATPTNNTEARVLEEQDPAGGTSATELVAPALTGVNPWAVSADDWAVICCGVPELALI